MAKYGLSHSRVEPLGPSQNVNFKVKVPGGTDFVLRFHQSTRDIAVLESESAWLTFLARSTLKVSEPILLPSGKFVLELEGQLISLLQWVEGRVFEPLTQSQARMAGIAMAELHTRAEQFDKPLGFRRPYYDQAYFWGQLEVLCGLPLFSADLELLNLATSKALEVFDTSQANFGLIHADFQPGNLVFYKDEVCVIDFDRCGFGPWGFDIATALGFLDKESRPGFLAGFTSLRPLPLHFDQQLESFLILAHLDNLAFLAPQPKEAHFVETEMWPYLRQKLAQFVGC